MQDKLLADLLSILKNEYEKYEKLQETADKKTEALVENEIDGLADIVEKEDEIITNIEDLEESRNNLVKKLLDLYEVKEEEINYSELTGYLPDEWQDEFDPIRDDLLESIENLHEKNEENRMLLNEAVKLNKFSINMLQKVLEPVSGTYNKDKNSEKKQGYNIVDRKA
jgi:flagellar biosynthesis/type III secretory pathway chaperone